VRPGRIFTIGHSTRTAEDFLGLLRREGVAQLVDVRSFPSSKRYPHFNQEQLSAQLRTAGIGYTHMPELGGRRTPRRDSANTEWKNSGFRGYADYMETRAFERALDELINTAASQATAIMCAEAVPWRCHRSLIADALTARGAEVLHIMDAGAKPHTLTAFARVVDGRIRYNSAAEPGLFDRS
jgi:uncharacterized protein (DUF488 family)